MRLLGRARLHSLRKKALYQGAPFRRAVKHEKQPGFSRGPDLSRNAGSEDSPERASFSRAVADRQEGGL
jgi:hypothetical protein